jgi:hypothetical protein
MAIELLRIRFLQEAAEKQGKEKRRRERFEAAMAAMQGLLGTMMHVTTGPNGEAMIRSAVMKHQAVASESVRYADALIAELDKPATKAGEGEE